MKNQQVFTLNIGKNGNFMNKEKLEKLKEKLKKSSIGIAGLGGLGSNAAISLARTGIWTGIMRVGT